VVPFAEVCPHCHAEHPTDEFLGRTLRGNIAIESVLGVGGMGIVYKGNETHLDRPVAVKVLHGTGQLTPRVIEYFMREAKVLSRLRHPNLVSVLDFGQDQDGTLFLVLEYIPGKSLERLLEDNEPFSFQRALKIIIQVLSALEEVHKHQIVHRDLKPGNLLLEQVAGQGDFVKVLDFGIAKILQSDAPQPHGRDGFRTEVGTAVGTPQYMSPEQAQGLNLDGRSDIYSAGLILYELIAQAPPHEGNNIVEILMRKVADDVPPPSSKRADLTIPPVLDRICLKALARQPDDRYPTPAAFRQDLERAISELDRANLSRLRPEQHSTDPTAPTRANPSAASAERAGTLLAIQPMIMGDLDVGAKTPPERFEAIWAFIRKLVEVSGGSLSKPSRGVALAFFPDTSDGVSTLTHAAMAALRLRDSASRQFAYARFRVGLTRTKPSSHAQDQERASTLAARAQSGQVLADAQQCRQLSRVLRVEEQRDALELLEPLAVSHPSLSMVRLPAVPKSGQPDPELPGRPAQSQRLLAALRDISADRPGAALLLHGPEGVGKSHAVEYVRRLARGTGLATLEAHCCETLLDRPMRPLFDLAFQAIGDDEDKPPQRSSDRLRRGLQALGLGDTSTSDVLEQYISGTGDDPWVMFNGHSCALTYATIRRARHLFPFQERRLAFTRAMRELLHKLTDAGGTVLILEDLDRADPCTLACVPGLCALAKERPLLLVGTSTRKDVEGLQEFEPVKLDPFTHDEARHFWRTLKDHSPHLFAAYQQAEEPHAHEAQMLQVSQGLPLYLARWAHQPLPGAPPPNARELIAAQVAALPGRLRRLLLVAAVLGESFEQTVLEGLFPLSKALTAALEGAEGGGWLERCPQEPGLWRFSNPKLRRTIYRAISHDERLHYHQNIFEGLQKAEVSSRQVLLESIHAQHGGQLQAVFARNLIVGDRMTLAGDISRGLDFYLIAHKAAEQIARLEPSFAPQHEALSLKLADAFLQLNQIPKAMTLLQKVEMHDAELWLRAEVLQLRGMATGQDLSVALQRGKQALQRAPRDSACTVELLELLADIASRAGLHRDAVALLDQGQRSLGRVPEVPDDLQHLHWRLWLTRAVFYARVGKLDEAEAALQEAAQQALAAKDSAGATQVCHALCSLSLRRAQPQKARKLCLDTLQSGEFLLRPAQRIALLQNLGRLHKALQRPAEAQQNFHDARVLATETGWVEILRSLDAEEAVSGAMEPDPKGR
jgi:serine/threonine protein kinase/tetratricopeptide (TPR) repeat protein